MAKLYRKKVYLLAIKNPGPDHQFFRSVPGPGYQTMGYETGEWLTHKVAGKGHNLFFNILIHICRDRAVAQE